MQNQCTKSVFIRNPIPFQIVNFLILTPYFNL